MTPGGGGGAPSVLTVVGPMHHRLPGARPPQPAKGRVSVGKGGGLRTCDIWGNELWWREILVPILKYGCKIWYKVPAWGTRTSIDRAWRLSLPMGLWLVAVAVVALSIYECSVFSQLKLTAH